MRVRALAEAALESAKECAASNRLEDAIKHSLYGLRVTTGFTRPFTIRDEIFDFLCRVDPHGSTRKTVTLASPGTWNLSL